MTRDSLGRFTGGRKGRKPKTASAVYVNPRRRTVKKRTSTRRRVLRNPRFDPFGSALKGLSGAAAALTGKVATRAVPEMVNLPRQGNVGLATEALVALGVGLVGDALVPRWGDYIMAGAFMGPLERVIRDANIPVLSTALSGYVPTSRNPFRRDYPRVGSYSSGAPLGSYASTGRNGFSVPAEVVQGRMYRS